MSKQEIKPCKFANGTCIHCAATEQSDCEGWVCSPMPVQEDAFEGWVKIDEVRKHFDSVGCGTIYKTAGEDRVPLYTAPPKHWQGLTDEEMSDIVADIDADFGDLLWKVVCLTKIIQAELKERNT